MSTGAQIKFTWGHLGLVCIFLFTPKGLLCELGTVSSLSEDAVPSLLQGDYVLGSRKKKNRMKVFYIIDDPHAKVQPASFIPEGKLTSNQSTKDMLV